MQFGEEENLFPLPVVERRTVQPETLIVISTTLSTEFRSEYKNRKVALGPNSYIHTGLIFSARLVGGVLFLTMEV
jgi:hypothetical protein